MPNIIWFDSIPQESQVSSQPWRNGYPHNMALLSQDMSVDCSIGIPQRLRIVLM